MKSASYGGAFLSLKHIAGEHRDLWFRARRLIELVSEVRNEQAMQSAFTELKSQLVELGDLMQRHLAEEAAGGYLEEAVARVPRLAHEADRIDGQHPSLTREVAALVETTTTTIPSLEAWLQIGAAVERFGRKLLAHEEAENRILQEGFNEDPALFDFPKEN
jgi:hypothetical protein